MGKQTSKMISSLQNPIVKHFVKLRENRQYREEHLSAIVPSRVLIEELAREITPKMTLVQEGAQPPKISGPFYFVSHGILQKITGVPSPDEVVAEFPLPHKASLQGKRFIAALDKISDPGNLGTLMRTALAFGWEGLFFLPGCVDPFHEKAIRASRAASFRIPIQEGSWEELQEIIEQGKLNAYVADVGGEDFRKQKKKGNVLLILSSEAHGPSENALQLGKKITIPITEKMESLNVAVAGGILMYFFKSDYVIK